MVTTHLDIGSSLPSVKQEPVEPVRQKSVEGFLVKFQNDSNGTQQIWFPDRQAIRLPAHQFFETVIKNPENIYSRYSLIKYCEDGEVKLEIRPGWKEIEQEWPVIEFLNLAGKNLEILSFQDFKVTMPRGIPILKSWSVFSPLSEWRNYTIKLCDSPQPEYTEVQTQKMTEHIESTVELEGYVDKVEYERPIEKKVAIVHEATVLQKADIVLENKRSPDELELLKLMQEDSLTKEKEYRMHK